MRIERIQYPQVRKIPVPMVACIGYFDGMHLGHQALIKKTIEVAKELDVESALITFDPDPWVTLKNLENVKHITPLNQRTNLAVKMGIDNIIILSFTKEMANLSAQSFLNDILMKCNLKALVCGFDFHYGKNGEGDVHRLKKDASFDVYEIASVDEGGEKISSTRITKCIEEGDMELAERLLGYPFEIIGYVRHGKHQGVTIGFPTANIAYSDEFLLPKPGVYAGYAFVNGAKYMCMINIGHNPTFNYSQELSMEAHLIDFKGNLYDRRIRIQFKKYIREEKKFQFVGNLIMQLEQDRFAIRKYLGTIHE